MVQYHRDTEPPDDQAEAAGDDLDPPPFQPTSPAFDTALSKIPHPLVAAARAIASTSAPLPHVSLALPIDDFSDITAELVLNSQDLDLFLRDTQYLQLSDDPSNSSAQLPINIPDLFSSDAQRPLSPPDDPLLPPRISPPTCQPLPQPHPQPQPQPQPNTAPAQHVNHAAQIPLIPSIASATASHQRPITVPKPATDTLPAPQGPPIKSLPSESPPFSTPAWSPASTPAPPTSTTLQSLIAQRPSSVNSRRTRPLTSTKRQQRPSRVPQTQKVNPIKIAPRASVPSRSVTPAQTLIADVPPAQKSSFFPPSASNPKQQKRLTAKEAPSLETTRQHFPMPLVSAVTPPHDMISLAHPVSQQQVSHHLLAQGPLQEHRPHMNQLSMGVHPTNANIVPLISNMYPVHPSPFPWSQCASQINTNTDIKVFQQAGLAAQHPQAKHLIHVHDGAGALPHQVVGASSFAKGNTQHSTKPGAHVVVPHSLDMTMQPTHPRAARSLQQRTAPSLAPHHIFTPYIPARVVYDPNLFGMPNFADPHMMAPVTPGIPVPPVPAPAHTVVNPLKGDLHHTTHVGAAITARASTSKSPEVQAKDVSPPAPSSSRCADQVPTPPSSTHADSVAIAEGVRMDGVSGAPSFAAQAVAVSVDGIQRYLPRQPAAKLDRHPVLGRLQLKSVTNAITAARIKNCSADGRAVDAHVTFKSDLRDGTGCSLRPNGGEGPSEGMDMEKIEPIIKHAGTEDSRSTNSERRQGPMRMQKKRLVWTPDLHDRFVKAIDAVGGKQAAPKTIVTIMNVDGLTTDHVKSHLQKYRNSLRKEADEEAKAMGSIDINNGLGGDKGDHYKGTVHGTRSSPSSFVVKKMEGGSSFGVAIDKVASSSNLHSGQGIPQSLVVVANTCSGDGVINTGESAAHGADGRIAREERNEVKGDDGDDKERTNKDEVNVKGGKDGNSSAMRHESVDVVGAEICDVDNEKSGVSSGWNSPAQRNLELELVKERTLQMQLQLQMMVYRTIELERKVQQEHGKNGVVNVREESGMCAVGAEKSEAGDKVAEGENVRAWERNEEAVVTGKRKESDREGLSDGRWTEKRPRKEEETVHDADEVANVQTELTALLGEQMEMGKNFEAVQVLLDERIECDSGEPERIGGHGGKVVEQDVMAGDAESVNREGDNGDGVKDLGGGKCETDVGGVGGRSVRAAVM